MGTVMLLVLGLFAVTYGLPAQNGQRDTFAISSNHFMDELVRAGDNGLETAGAGNKDLQALLRSIDTELQKARREHQHSLKHQPKSAKCSCINYNCGCCIKIERWNQTACANFSYLPAPEYGVAVTLSLNGKIILNERVSVKNPPPICAGVPYLEKLASICLHFYNMTVKDKSLSGCAKIEARIEHVKLEDYDLGCFKIPPGGRMFKGDNYWEDASHIKGSHVQRNGVKFPFRKRGDMPWKYNGL